MRLKAVQAFSTPKDARAITQVRAFIFENVLESPTVQETKGLDWIEETEMTDTEEEMKLRKRKS